MVTNAKQELCATFKRKAGALRHGLADRTSIRSYQMGYGGYGFRWAPYVSVGQKLAMAKRKAAQVAKKQKREPSPVEVKGRNIATSFWGKAWCDNLAAYSDFSNRLPRGATYVRNGSVADLVISAGKIEAIVAGSEPYSVSISIDKLVKATWNKIKQNCSSSIDSLFDLLAGRLSNGVMQGLTDKKDGCFPSPREIKMKCSCPDYSYCCKHIAAVMYGVGNRLDRQPELLFLLRGVDHAELVSAAVSKDNLDRELGSSGGSGIAESDLSELFGIELESGATPGQSSPSMTPRKSSKKRGATPKLGSSSKRAPSARDDLAKAERKHSAVTGARLGRAVVAKAEVAKTGLTKKSRPIHGTESYSKSKSHVVSKNSPSHTKSVSKLSEMNSGKTKQVASGPAGLKTKLETKQQKSSVSTTKSGKATTTMTKTSAAKKSSLKSAATKRSTSARAVSLNAALPKKTKPK